MRITRLYTGDDNQSHFDEPEIHLESRGPLGFFTEPTGVKAFFFREVPAGYRYTVAQCGLQGVCYHSRRKG